MKKKHKGEEFEEFDVGETTEEFEEFDVMKEEAEEEGFAATIQAMGGIIEDENEFASILKARDAVEKQFLADPSDKAFASTAEGEPAGLDNIVGVGIGENLVGGYFTGEVAIKVFVKEKLGGEEISSAAFVPESVDGVMTDVEATGDIYTQRYTGRYRPAPCGVSIGHCNMNMAGTLGCLVTRQGRLFILSNNHVMALENKGPVGVGIPQPGRLDGGVCPRDIIARLTQWIPINFGGINYVDAAIAQTDPRLVDRRMLRPGGRRESLRSPVLAPALNMNVQKSGRTTQYRRGHIDAINVTVNVGYSGGTAQFRDQFRVRGIGGIFSDRGDSGSLVTKYPENNPVGLLFAGNATNNMTFCNDIRRVLSSFGASIVY